MVGRAEKEPEDRISRIIEALQQPLEQGSDDAESQHGNVTSIAPNPKRSWSIKRVLDVDLPIGSGEVESGHRYIVRDRLKLPRVWWKQQDTPSMLALRVCRANASWAGY